MAAFIDVQRPFINLWPEGVEPRFAALIRIEILESAAQPVNSDALTPRASINL